MSVVIPFSTEFANFSEQITLDNQLFRFDFLWNGRAEQWDMSVLDVNLTPLVEGIKLVLGYSLFDQWVDRGLPPGELYAVDTTEEEIRITRTNLGTIVELIYIPEDELWHSLIAQHL